LAEVPVDPTTTLEQVQTWPVEDRLALVFRVWDQLVDGGWQPELTDDLKAELDRRLAAHQANPGTVVTWEEVVAQVRRPR
jgi:putative addiction module component (TIGR02574 family)